MSIPKIIHLMWFSGDEYPKNIQECIDSWKRMLPDFEIEVWDYQKAFQLNIQYVMEALQYKKWAFAADVVRLYALYIRGGVYMDSDVFIKRRFDKFMYGKVNLFQEYHTNFPIHECIDEEGNRIISEHVKGVGIQAAFMIAEPGNPFIKGLLDVYKQMHFEMEKTGKLRGERLLAPSTYAIYAEDYGYRYIDEEQHLKGNIIVYPSRYVAGNEAEQTPDSFAVHRCEHSWYDYTILQKIKKRLETVIKYPK